MAVDAKEEAKKECVRATRQLFRLMGQHLTDREAEEAAVLLAQIVETVPKTKLSIRKPPADLL